MKNRIQPLVTIVTPSYNQGQFIEETILSVLNQTYKNIQYIIVDGGSTDNTMEVVNRYKNKVDIIIHEKDNGQSDAINKGFKLAKGELVGWINSDDILYENCVNDIVELYNNKNDGSIYYCSFNDRIDKVGNKIGSYERVISNRNYLLNTDYNVIQQASFYKLDIVKKIDYLNPNIYYCMDLDLWLRLLNHGPIYYTDKTPLSAFRVWEETKTTNGKRKFLQDIRNTLRNNGANIFSPNIRRTYFYELKQIIKYFIPFK
jgi:glycosyltransferase involved in cell wall biosynthesis